LFSYFDTFFSVGFWLQEERHILTPQTALSKCNYFRIGYINEYFYETSHTEGKIEEKIKLTGRRGRRRKQLHYEHYCQDATVFRIGYINEYFYETSVLKERLKKR
jgi:hypothetical protein